MARTVDRASESPPELPSLDPGIQLLELPERTLAPLHSLVLDHLLVTGGEARWIDARNRGPSQLLAALAPADRVLDRVRIARGFTAFQHAAIVEAAESTLSDASLLVAPALDSQYRDDDVRGVEPRELLLRVLARLAGYARRFDLPVLVTRTADDRLGRPVRAAARDVIAVERTPFGPRFTAGDFETLVYPGTDGRPVQTTLAFWRRVLEAREPLHSTEPTAPQTPTAAQEVTPRGTH
ncbi:MAG: hypothetical protein ABEJ71_03515 [Halodesulfurarchaeum sp.]